MSHANVCAALFALGSLFAASAAGVTVHRSFRGGYPSAVSEARQNSAETGATFGTRVSPRTKVVAYKKIVGRVTRVDEGDVMRVTNAAGTHKIRLDKIDAPESDQPYGEESTRFLSDLVMNREVEVLWAEKGKGGFVLGVVYLKHAKGMVEVNLTMVKNGFAWNASKFDRRAVYADAENDARRLRRGLWADDAPVSPSQWRKSKRGM